MQADCERVYKMVGVHRGTVLLTSLTSLAHFFFGQCQLSFEIYGATVYMAGDSVLSEGLRND